MTSFSETSGIRCALFIRPADPLTAQSARSNVIPYKDSKPSQGKAP